MQDPSTSPTHRSRKSQLLLCLIFVLSLPLLNPWVRGDGVGYRAFVRALLIQQKPDFDVETFYKMVRTSLFKSIPLVGKGFEIEPELSIKLAKRGARMSEVPIPSMPSLDCQRKFLISMMSDS